MQNPSMPFSMRQRVSAEAQWIALICMVDLATTLYWVSQGQAREGNPVMAWFLHHGHVPFIAVKIATFAPALVLLEWYRTQKPEMVTRLLRLAIVGYVAIWVGGVLPSAVLHLAPRLFLMLGP